MNTNDSDMGATKALLDRLRDELPEVCNQAQIVGSWVWIEFAVPPEAAIRKKLKQLGFFWNGVRKCWQHPCGGERMPGRWSDPRRVYPTREAKVLMANENFPRSKLITAKEYKVISLRECPLPNEMVILDSPIKTAEYWRLHIATNPYFNPECECFAVLVLNTRHRIKGHQLVSFGVMDSLLVHPREVFRGALIASAASIVMAHNHPSGEPEPSEADIRMTRDLIRAGQLLKIQVLDHVIIGNQSHASLRELGYFA